MPRDWEGMLYGMISTAGTLDGMVGLGKNSSLKPHVPSRIHQSQKIFWHLIQISFPHYHLWGQRPRAARMACAFPRCSFSTTIDSQGPHPASCQGCLALFTFSFFSSTRTDSVILSRLLPSHTWRQFCMNFFCPFHPVACGHTEYAVRVGRGSQCLLPKTS